MNNTVIDWVRHAESCSNLLEHQSTDKYANEKDFHQFTQHLNDEANEQMNDKQLPFRSYIHDYANRKLNKIKQFNQNKLEQSSLFERDYMSKSKWLLHPPLSFAGMTQAMKLFVRDVMPKSKWLLHPPLSYIGILQAMKLGEDAQFIKIVQKKNVFITSATARTIMTAFLSLMNFDTTIIVVPFINERDNYAGEFDLDHTDRGIHPDIIDEIVLKILTWCRTYLGITKEISIDTEFYKKSCMKYDHLRPTVSNTEHFKNHILDDIRHYTHKTQLNILAYAHGYVITDLLKRKNPGFVPHLYPNVSIFRETNTSMRQITKGVNIRAKTSIGITGENNTFDEQKNVCSLKSLRGDINQSFISKFHTRSKSQRNRKRYTSRKVSSVRSTI
jgi:hypothetical protein